MPASWTARWRIVLLLVSALSSLLTGPVSTAQQKSAKPPQCKRAVVEASVKSGEGFDVVFAKGLRFYLEPLASGWIVRVLAADEPRGPHDYAELASPPYKSVSPLLIGTDWSFRAQDAIAWNPRRFHYAATRQTFEALRATYAGVLKDDPASVATAAGLAAQQPEGVLQILDARFVPGVANQSQMAAMVATHFAETPHTAEQSASASALGKILELRFRVEFDLLPGVRAAAGVRETTAVCPVRPTASTQDASHQ